MFFSFDGVDGVGKTTQLNAQLGGEVFKTQPLEADELLLCLAASTVVFWGVELEKWTVRKGWLYGSDAGSTPLPR